ncbi:restriction endonuclease subunit S [Streptococcus cuniculipharyngis]|uniref:Restriction endonuclease subunit S n=2 Tax=Streptococcus cuniculipharyngis TaxID=1562651 RepID=A0A5C5SH45_9STRE|nr:restriction endonuclease subunit S [Streptococcus cuniculipharyngis]
MLCDFSVSKYANVSNLEKETFLLKDRDVLFNRTNSFEWVGRTGIFYQQDDSDFIFASYLVRFVPNEDIILPEYLTAYLNTKYGIWDLKRRARQSINQTNINPEEVKETFIPLLDRDFQLKIKDCFDNAKLSLKKSQNIYIEAETLLLDNLGLTDFQAIQNPVNIKSLKDSFLQTGRLDAEFYQPIYEQLEKFIQTHSNGFEKLGKVCRLHDENYTPNENQEYDYIELSNIGKSGEITGSTKALGKDLPSRARRKVRTNQVMISSIEGSLQSCAIVPPHYDNSLCSTGFYVLSSDKINAETLLVLFKSSLMQQILKKNCSGTILTAINKEDLLNIPLPIISQNTQEKIAEYIRQSNDLREQAQQLLTEAKASVENEIENSVKVSRGGGGVEIDSLLAKALYYERLAEWTLIELLIEQKTSNVSVQTLSQSFGMSGRLDAEYYQPKFTQLLESMAKFDCVRLGDIVDLYKSIEPGSQAYQSQGVPFVRVSNLSKYGITKSDKFLDPESFNEAIRPKRDTILLSKDGTVGIAYRVPEDLDVITSGAIVHLSLKTDRVLPDYLALVINSAVVQLQAERDAGGSIIQHWKPSEILDVRIPVLPRTIQLRISEKIQQSFTLKAKSEELLAEAKRLVENEIENMR